MDIVNGFLDVLGAAAQVMFVFVFLGVGALLFATFLGLFVVTFMDIFGREDLALGKLVWPLLVLLGPGIGLIAYWLSKPRSEPPMTHSAALVRHVEQPALDRAA